MDLLNQHTNTWVDVILPLALPQTYTYNVPQELMPEIKIGCRVEVMLGKNKKYAGIIKRITDKEPAYPTKPIIQVLDDEPIVFPNQLSLWEWMASYYMCSEGEVMAAALPAHFKLSSESILIFNEEAGDDFTDLDAQEFVVAEALSIRKQLNMSEVQMLLDKQQVYPVVKRIIDKKIGYVWERLSEKYKPKKEKFVYLHEKWRDEKALSQLLNEWSKGPKQLELLLAFLHLEKTEAEVKQSDLLKHANATSAQLNALVEKEILQVKQKNVDRIAQLPKVLNIPGALSEPQEKALEKVRDVLSQKQVCLLHGVTGSGKTWIYVKLMESFLQQGKQIVYLVPEIALTAQLVRRLQVFFGGYISVYHSKFNDQERVELWNKVRSGETRIVLGARSALLLPFINPGLIIIDEEHDASYKQQEPAPRYHARDTAIYYGSVTNAKVLLGSATPSYESYHNALQDKYGLVTLEERFGQAQLASVEIAQQYLQQKAKPIIGERLKTAIEETIDQKKQVILFQNRRGYLPYMICVKCGFIPKCNHCDVSLTMHKYTHKLHCHYCGSTYPQLVSCVACGSQEWSERNFGTEKAEEYLTDQFPNLKIARMDMDTVKGKHAHDQIVGQFEQQKIDLLVGTQMVVKGLDFDHVGLVGILDADGILSFTDFRVNERAFQLMEQVSGRAGRKNDPGKVIIQAVNTKHHVLSFVQQHDFVGLYEKEIVQRQHFQYPPFTRLIKIIVKHKQKEMAMMAADKLAEILKKDMEITGPAEPVIGRIRNQYLMEIMIKLNKDGRIPKWKKLIQNAIQLMYTDKRLSTVKVIPDVDPI